MRGVGDTIDHYRIEAVLALEPEVHSYRVRDLQLGATQVLKVRVGASRADRDRLLGEGQIQTRLRHPNLVRVSDVLLVDGHPALVTELVEGPTLEGWLSEGKISVDIALALFRGIVTGIGVAHGAGLIHRGLCPRSVLFGRGRSGAMVAKVDDLGVGARALRYLAPEQLRDPALSDPRVDLWALGCILYELVCGAPAFVEVDPARLREAIASGRYPDPEASLAPRSPSRVKEGILGLLQVDPEARLQSCSALWQALWDVELPKVLLPGWTPGKSSEPMSEDRSQSARPTDRMAARSVPPSAVDTLVERRPPVDLDAEPPTVPRPRAPLAGDETARWVLDAQAAWIPTPGSAVERSPPTPVRSASRWYLAAILAAGLPAGLFALAIGGLVIRQTGGWLEGPEEARISVDGDATRVWLEASGRKIPLDRPVPAGSYEIRASWEDGVSRAGGSLQVRAGSEIRLRCVSFTCTETAR